MFLILLCDWVAGRIITGILSAALRNSSLWSLCKSAVCTSYDSRGRTEADWKGSAGTVWALKSTSVCVCVCVCASVRSVGVFESISMRCTKTMCEFQKRTLEECCSPRENVDGVFWWPWWPHKFCSTNERFCLKSTFFGSRAQINHLPNKTAYFGPSGSDSASVHLKETYKVDVTLHCDTETDVQTGCTENHIC